MEERREGGAPDLSGLRSYYPLRAARGLRTVLLGLIGLQVALAVSRLFGDPDTFDVVFAIVMLGGFAYLLCACFAWPPSTLLTTEGVGLRDGLPRYRTVPWSRVRTVRVEGGWYDTSALVLEDGRSRRLIGVPAGDARRLAEALDARAQR
ncbi:PH domain-containing protein [Kineococcus terrestris]|uniref:PH domain-containing protein n=1 Tax=Kineococcus terrestris TaxID=2044856 RepID=UPI0034DB2B94